MVLSLTTGVTLRRVNEGHPEPPRDDEAETGDPAGNAPTQPAPERTLDELSDQELTARGYRRESFNGFPLVVRRSSFLVGFFGLPPEVQRYRDGIVDARVVARTLVRVRVAHAPAGFSYTADQFEDLVRLVASVAVDPPLPAGSPVAVADALAEAQRQLEEQVVAPFLKARDMAQTGVEALDGFHRRVSKAIEGSFLGRFLLPPQDPYPGLPSGLGLSDLEGSTDRFRPYRMQELGHSNFGRFGTSSAARRTASSGLQRQLMGPSELGRAIGDVVTRLQAGSVIPPDSVTRLQGNSTVTPEEARAAAADAAELARKEGYQDAADLLDLTSSTLASSQGSTGMTAEQEKVLAEKAIFFYTNIAPQMKSDRKFAAIMALVTFVMFFAQLGAPYVLPDPYPQLPEPRRGLPSASPGSTPSKPSGPEGARDIKPPASSGLVSQPQPTSKSGDSPRSNKGSEPLERP